MKGVYVLVVEMNQYLSFSIRTLGEMHFDEGMWLYVGSALGNGSTNLENRLKRHFRKKKTNHWHIDHLLSQKVTLQSAIWAETPQSYECEIAKSLEKNRMCIPGPRGFGASDCRKGCSSHLFHCLKSRQVNEIVDYVFRNLGLRPLITTDGSTLNSIPL